jgi:aryl-alcohol dehydrogenase-like predicted oxidoreductase
LTVLNKAIDLGLNFIDTALAYGEGHGERLAGQVVRERDETVYVATKIPPKTRTWPAPSGPSLDETFPSEYVRECIEQSLKNLELEAIDVQHFHFWHYEWAGAGDLLEAIEGLKRVGKIRFFGVSMKDHQPANAVKLIEAGVVDTVQVIYNVFDQSPEDELFPACQDNDVGVIVRVPFDEGALTGGSRRRSPSRTATSATTTSAATASRKFMNGCGP